MPKQGLGTKGHTPESQGKAQVFLLMLEREGRWEVASDHGGALHGKHGGRDLHAGDAGGRQVCMQESRSLCSPLWWGAWVGQRAVSVTSGTTLKASPGLTWS
jgi:hypothetical protein